ncbi:hypothetical protein NA56DRAFT_707160 [Hyaloscypha hepaticicola]|uniref:Uncharacterized protein n=1 Tax=Hyaloscypha hepaticicola TaxID=2082293 RepID=A0A2J6PVR2_9HELO|nr:hypothetical protein NA56DRAFT_707160 [Hyaloscypha hepaticicola]
MATSPMAMWKYSPDRIHPIRVGDNDHIMRNRGDGGDWSSGGFVRRSQEVAQMSCARAGGWTWTLKLEAHAEMNPLKKTLGVRAELLATQHAALLSDLGKLGHCNKIPKYEYTWDSNVPHGETTSGMVSFTLSVILAYAIGNILFNWLINLGSSDLDLL